MKLYIGFDADVGAIEGAILIFAHSSREARKVGWPFIKAWHDTEWIGMRVRLLKKDLKHLRKNANQEKLMAGIPQVIDSPEGCPNCEFWGGGEIFNNRCDFCLDDGNF